MTRHRLTTATVILMALLVSGVASAQGVYPSSSEPAGLGPRIVAHFGEARQMVAAAQQRARLLRGELRALWSSDGDRQHRIDKRGELRQAQVELREAREQVREQARELRRTGEQGRSAEAHTAVSERRAERQAAATRGPERAAQAHAAAADRRAERQADGTRGRQRAAQARAAGADRGAEQQVRARAGRRMGPGSDRGLQGSGDGRSRQAHRRGAGRSTPQ